MAIINGTNGNDTLVGTSGDDEINGLGGDDTVYASNGNDVIDGGVGFDTVWYEGTRSDYSINVSVSGPTYVLSLDSNSLDTLANIEQIMFAEEAPNTPKKFQLSALDGDNGFLFPIGAGDPATFVDLNGDSFADVVVATGGASTASILFGSADSFGAVYNVPLDGSNGFVLDTVTGAQPTSIANVGDVNDDGIDDLLVGVAPHRPVTADPDYWDTKGHAFLIFGSTGGFPAAFDFENPTPAEGFVFRGQTNNDYVGHRVGGAGDVNADGIDDFMLSSGGDTYVVFGSTAGVPQLSPSSLDGTNGFVFDPVGDLSRAGDLNGDGIDDIMVGANVIFGNSTGFAATLDSTGLDGTNGFVITNGDGVSGFATAVSGLGDVNNDGIEDVIIGSYNSGGYVVFGHTGAYSASFDVTVLDGANGFKINPFASVDDLGRSVARIGDVNNDGVNDILIGAPGASANALFNSGISYVIYGSKLGFAPSLDVSNLDGQNGYHLLGEDVSVQSGYLVGGGGDINNDGFDDFLIATRYRATYGSPEYPFKTYVVFGKPTTIINAELLVGTDGPDVLTGTGETVEIHGKLGNDVLTGANGPDEIFGGAGDDTINGLGGDDLLEGDVGEDTINGGDGDDRIDGNNDADELNGDAGNDTLEGGSGNDTLNGGDDDDTISGGDGGDQINGGEGNDVLKGGPGDDTIDGGAGIDLLYEGMNHAPLTVNLAAGTVSSADTGSDTISNVENVIGGVGDDILIGDAMDNRLEGSSGNDTLSGLAGNDTLVGGAGNDMLDGGADDDQFDASVSTADLIVSLAAGTATGSDIGSDTLANIENVVVGSGNDVVLGDTTDNSLSGQLGNDDLRGGGGNDVIEGGDGADILGGGGGNDWLNDGDGDDTVFGGDGYDVVIASLGDDTLNGGDWLDYIDARTQVDGIAVDLYYGTASGAGIGSDTISHFEAVYGGAGNDTVRGTRQDDMLYGFDGDDILSGRAGNDTIAGGGGNDILVAGYGNDVVNGQAGLDYFDARAITTAVVVDLGAGTATGADIGSDTLFNIEAVYGGSGNDTITGSAADNMLYGLGGDDMLSGDVGNDTLVGGQGNDTLNGGAGNDTESGGNGNDIFIASLGDDVLNGQGATDFFDASAATNAINVNLAVGTATGTDVGNDTLYDIEGVKAGAGDDTITGGATAELLYGRDGNDTINGGSGNDTINGNSDNDIVSGGIGSDFVVGGDGEDVVNGDAGNDTLAGGMGRDVLSGGADADIFYYTSSVDSGVGVPNRDLVTDFVSGIDTFDMTDTEFASYGGERANFTAANQLILDGDILKGSLDGSTTVFEIDMNGVTDLSNGDFIF